MKHSPNLVAAACAVQGGCCAALLHSITIPVGVVGRHKVRMLFVAAAKQPLLQKPLAHGIRGHLHSGYVHYTYLAAAHKHSRAHAFASTPQWQAYDDCIQRHR